MQQLERLRRKIDSCDRELIEILQERIELVEEITELKKKSCLKIRHPQREREVITRGLKRYRGNYQEEIKKIMEEIMSQSRKIQSRLILPCNLFLIGFMGVGKTTVGKKLAQQLEVAFYDIDELIEKKQGMTVSQIFSCRGEDFFREMEARTLQELIKEKNALISCGGGVVLNRTNVLRMQESGTIVYLKAKVKTLKNRLSKEEPGSRPILSQDAEKNTLEKIFKKREKLYEFAADVVIDTEEEQVDSICREILKKLPQGEFSQEKKR